jgi:hypothetical protein
MCVPFLLVTIFHDQDLTFEPGVSSTITHTFSLILHLKCCTGIFVEVTASDLGESVGFLATAAAAAVAYNLCIWGAGEKEFPFTSVTKVWCHFNSSYNCHYTRSLNIMFTEKVKLYYSQLIILICYSGNTGPAETHPIISFMNRYHENVWNVSLINTR